MVNEPENREETPMRTLVSSWLAVVGVGIVAAAGGQSHAANLTPLVSFNGTDGTNPGGSLIADAKGNLFGTTANGGAAGLGTVFEIAKTDRGYASAPTTLVSFSGVNGEDPLSNLITDAKGNLFGTTNFGGANGGGTVFEIVKTDGGYASAPKVLVNFCSLPNCADGANPEGAGVIADADGNLFGTTGLGGANGGGTVFEIIKTDRGYASAPKILVNFCALPNCADGSFPVAGLIADADGNLFGTTDGGGANGGGTVFEIVKTHHGYASTSTTLVSFCSLPNCADGAHPRAPLIVDAPKEICSARPPRAGRTTLARSSKSPRPTASTPAPPQL
jgi:uncharacterized repeat protein (TIGR03803 family)